MLILCLNDHRIEDTPGGCTGGALDCSILRCWSPSSGRNKTKEIDQDAPTVGPKGGRASGGAPLSTLLDASTTLRDGAGQLPL